MHITMYNRDYVNQKFLPGLLCMHLLYRHPCRGTQSLRWRYFVFLHSLLFEDKMIIYRHSPLIPDIAALLLFDPDARWNSMCYDLYLGENYPVAHLDDMAVARMSLLTYFARGSRVGYVIAARIRRLSKGRQFSVPASLTSQRFLDRDPMNLCAGSGEHDDLKRDAGDGHPCAPPVH